MKYSVWFYEKDIKIGTKLYSALGNFEVYSKPKVQFRLFRRNRYWYNIILYTGKLIPDEALYCHYKFINITN